ncbi:hypothetical protein J4410_02090 [Candidatus Woesearchaeota archaeon]|nr:hypothetical protein [Candidatus Woesearchaeota archaeon]
MTFPFFDRKAQELSLNVIIIAALGLIVLVIVVLIFMRESGDTSDTLNSCYTQAGQCYDGEFPMSCPNGTSYLYGGNCPDNTEGANQICCISLEKKN